MPSLIQKYQERQHISQLKKVYSILSQAYIMAKAEYGDISEWGLSNTVTNKQDSDGNMIYDSSGQVIVKNNLGKYLKQFEGKKQHTFKKYVSLDGRAFSSNTIDDDAVLYLADGTIVRIGWIWRSCKDPDVGCGDISIFFPENIAKIGVSNFWFYLTPQGIVPYGHQNHTRKFEDYCDIKNTKGIGASAQGRGCTAWALYNENMDYLHCNNLSWDGKRKCK